MVGGECILVGKDCAVFAMVTEWLRSGEGERWGEVGWGVGEGVRANGERGMLPADFRRPRSRDPRPRPCKVLGRTLPEPAGELGALELGELLWEELPADCEKSGAGLNEAVGDRGERL